MTRGFHRRGAEIRRGFAEKKEGKKERGYSRFLSLSLLLLCVSSALILRLCGENKLLSSAALGSINSHPYD
jgi:hypothetical protein